MRRLILLVASILAVFAGATFAEQSPAAFVTALYGEAGPQGQYEQPLPITSEAAMRKVYLSKALRRALADLDKRTPRGEVSELDFDPVSNGNDPSVHDLKIKTEAESASQATVVADFRSHEDKERSVLRFLLVREDGAWKVDDIVSVGKTPWRLGEIVRGH